MPSVAQQDLLTLWTAAELEEQLESLSRQRIYQLVRQGAIPHIRVGRAIRFSPRQIAQWIEAGGCSEPPSGESPQ